MRIFLLLLSYIIWIETLPIYALIDFEEAILSENWHSRSLGEVYQEAIQENLGATAASCQIEFKGRSSGSAWKYWVNGFCAAIQERPESDSISIDARRYSVVRHEWVTEGDSISIDARRYSVLRHEWVAHNQLRGRGQEVKYTLSLLINICDKY